MPHDIRPTTPDDLPELSRFLTEGFHTPPDAPFASLDVLSWKYFDDRGVEAGDAPRSWLGLDAESGRIVGHLGVTPGRWHGGGLPAAGVSTLHMIDWLSSAAGRGVGAALMRRSHRGVDTQYGLGGSDDGRGVGGGGGYALVRLVPVYQRVLRPGRHLRLVDPGRGRAWGLLRAARDAARRLARPSRRPSARVEIEPVAAFGDEVRAVLDAYASRASFTTRAPDFLEHMLRHPRGGLTGWRIVAAGGAPRGFAVLSVVANPTRGRVGKIVECLLDRDDDALWHASAVALTVELERQGADLVEAVAATEWTARALRASGYAPAHHLEFRLRDRSNLLPRGEPFHLTFLEADYACL